MFNPAPTDEQCLDAVKAKESQPTLAAAASSIGITASALKHRAKLAAERGLLGTKPVLPGFRLSQTTAVTDADGNVVREYIQQKPDTGDVFEVPPGHAVKGVSALVGADGRTIQQWIKTKEQTQTDLIAAIKEEFSQYHGVAKLTKPPKDTLGDLMQVYPICDTHIGMLSWGPETGESNDLRIGVDRVDNGLQRLISLAPPAETAVIIQTGDFLHADSQSNATPASGHQLDVDGRAQKVKLAGVQLLRRSIDYALQKHSRVIV
ncbi:hypothetical protein ACVIYH_009132, partial [Bradyrhizobium diazoefficiens]